MKYCIEKGRRTKRSVFLTAMVFSFAVIVFGIFQIMPAAETSANSRCVLGISKQADKTSANVGDIVIFTLNFFNSGNADCTGVGVKIKDIVDSNITFLSETHSDNIAPGYGDDLLYDSLRRELVWNANILNPEETGWISWSGTINEITPCGNLNISNSASITSKEYSDFGDMVNSNEVVIGINNPCPTPAPEPVPDFPLCPLQGNGDIAHYDTGFHQIVGDGLVLGRDDVYSIDNSNYVQCFCPEGGGMGVQTNWYRTDNPVSGWYYENGSQWNLGDYNYSAQNIDYNCSILTPTPTPTLTSIPIPTFTPTVTPTPTFTPTPTVTPTMPASVGGGCAGSCGVVFLPPEPRIYVVKTPNTDILPPGGGEVIYSYQVYNPGSSFLTDVNLTDDKCGPIEFLGGDVSMDKRLDRGEIWKYSCRTVLKETTVNTAIATGKFGTRILTEKAKATVTVGGSGITDNSGTINFVKKAIPPELPFDGGLVNYVYTVSNPLNIPLTEVGINDDKCSPVNYIEGDINKDNKLDVQEIWTYLCRTTIASDTSNAATVNAKYGNKIITGRAYATVSVASSPPVIPKHFPKTGQGNNSGSPALLWYAVSAFVLFFSIKIALKAWRKYNV